MYIIVPVYKGLTVLQNCLESIQMTTDIPLILINDSSPDPSITQYLKTFVSNYQQAVLINNQKQEGFIKSVNKGFAYDKAKDVIIVNSDTIVTPQWVRKLKKWAYLNDDIATVTPFSNNATICSYPKICKANNIEQLNPDIINSFFEILAPEEIIELPTGVGFCMYIKRKYLEKIGYFNANLFRMGYGEENDFCRKAASISGKNIIALDTFIYHDDNISFDAKKKRVERAVELIHRLYPDYNRLVQQFVTEDPLFPFRRMVDILRFNYKYKPGILMVEHGLGGGTYKHIEELSKYLFYKEWRVFKLTPIINGFKLNIMEEDEEFELVYSSENWINVLAFLLPIIHIRLIHFHNILGYSPDILKIAGLSNIPFYVTIHDFFMLCPNYNLYLSKNNYYCQSIERIDQCKECHILREINSSLTITKWRQCFYQFLKKAQKIITPSIFTTKMVRKIYQDLKVKTYPHPEINDFKRFRPNQIGDIIHIGCLGSIGPHKGRSIFYECVELTRKRGYPIRWVLIGVSDLDANPKEEEYFVVTGKYTRESIPYFIDKYQINIVLLPSIFPETFCYSMSESISCGCPVIVPDIGVFPERIDQTKSGWILKSPLTAESICDFILQIKEYPEAFNSKLKNTETYQVNSFDTYYEHIYNQIYVKDQHIEKVKKLSKEDICYLQTVISKSNHFRKQTYQFPSSALVYQNILGLWNPEHMLNHRP